jgi:hypothetical protein
MLDALVDADAVANLQNAYGYYIDRKMWEDVADLFEADGSYEMFGAPPVRGPAAIRKALEAAHGPVGLRHGELNDHVQANLRVCISPDGREARARGLDFGMTGRNDGKAYWSTAIFDNRFVKRNGVWRVAAMRIIPRMATDYALGWGKQNEAGAGASLDVPALHCDEPARRKADIDPDQAQLKLQRLAARDAIENISSALGNYIDDFQWEELGRMFSAKGRREAPGVGFYVGPERITRMQQIRYGPMKSPRAFIPIHARTQPVVTVAADGRTATLRTRLLQFNTSRNAPGSMMAGIYEDEFLFENGRWAISSIEIDHTLQTVDYDHGWTGIAEGTGQRMTPPMAPLLRDYPPDAPLVGEMFAPYPAPGLMWFHYANPVSGRRPPYMTPKTAAVVSRSGGRE